MTKMLYILAFAAAAISGTANAQDYLRASVAFTRNNDGITCHGAMINASGYRVLATAAHCLGNFSNGGISLQDGSRSMDVIVHDDVSSRGRASNDDDFALVIFSQNSSQTSVRIDTNRKSTGSQVNVVVSRSGRLRSFTETVKGYTSNSTRTADIFLGTTNNANMQPGDSGSPVFAPDGSYLGALRGCVSDLCGFFSLHNDNPVSARVLYKANQRYPGIFNAGGGGGGGGGGTPRNYTCSAQCRIEYANPYAVATESVSENLIRATSSSAAAAQAQGTLQRNCQEFCDASRDAVDCRLSSAVSCF